MQKYEAELSAIEEKQLILDEQLGKKQDELVAARNRQKALVSAALRLSRTPPEASVIMPGDQVQAMQAARALELITANLKEQAESIRLQLEQLQGLRKKVEKSRSDIENKRKKLSTEQESLRTSVAQRQLLQKTLLREQAKQSSRIMELAKKAEDLQGLVATLGKEQQRRRSEVDVEKEEGVAGNKGKLRSFAAAKGKIRPPVAGKLTQRFGASDGKNSTSKGIEISARAGAQVTAPYDGEVVFSGTFLTYGRMVILRHSDEFHTLVAGLSKIDVSVGEFLLEGEPIGAMGDKESGNRLYVELRKNNQPVDPAPWLRGIKK
ncbi:MAG: hypothetical protein EBR02_02465 [Alphaproteobacteria bacterium]|nr:hypothetical protein [Alphaproteobacteria bacterium]